LRCLRRRPVRLMLTDCPLLVVSFQARFSCHPLPDRRAAGTRSGMVLAPLPVILQRRMLFMARQKFIHSAAE
jgi:hypothetical protein